MDSLIDKLDKCIFAGQDVIHYTKYKPDCKKCNGYNIKCEQEKIYKPYKDLKKNE